MKKALMTLTIISLLTIINAQGITNTLGGNTDSDIFIIKNEAGQNLFTATGNNRVGIGNIAPSSGLHVANGSITTTHNYGISFPHKSDKTNRNSGIFSELEDLKIRNNVTGKIIFLTGTTPGGAFRRLTIIDNGNVGIGTDDPKAKLHVEDRIRIGEDSKYSGVYGEIFHTGGGNGFRINANAGGGWADMYLQTDGNTRLFIESGGNVGIGTTSPSKRLYVNGSAGGTQAWNASDFRYKKNIQKITNALAGVLNLTGVKYEWINQSSDESTGFDDKVHYGLIAQEVEEVFPELVDNIGNTQQMKHIEYNGLVGILVESIKEQQQLISDLTERIEYLESK